LSAHIFITQLLLRYTLTPDVLRYVPDVFHLNHPMLERVI